MAVTERRPKTAARAEHLWGGGSVDCVVMRPFEDALHNYGFLGVLSGGLYREMFVSR